MALLRRRISDRNPLRSPSTRCTRSASWARRCARGLTGSGVQRAVKQLRALLGVTAFALTSDGQVIGFDGGAHHHETAAQADAPGHLGRRRAVPGDLLVTVRRAGVLLRRRRRQEGRGRRPVAARPGRRRHERVRAPDLHHRVESALVSHPSVAEAAVVGANDPHDRPGQAAVGRRRRRRGSNWSGNCASTCPARSDRSRSPGR
jgi:hypothetical protein